MNDNMENVKIQRELHLGRLLGEGGMGMVYEGFEGGFGSHAAVKILREELLDDPEVRERFDGEAHIMNSIEHPGCLPVYGWGIDSKGRPFYAMKQISGMTLTDLLAERGDKNRSLVWRRRLLRIFQSICETVGYAHEQGIVHRDLKPDNIMIDPFGSVYVIDWGIAKRMGGEEGGTDAGRTLAGAVMGSPGYMSPEQADGKSGRAGPGADVFALGVILYEILTGQAPFGGATERETMAHTINRDPEPPRRLNFWLSRSLAAVCMKALHKEPAQRYRNASQLAKDVSALNEGRPVSVVRPTPFERAVVWTRRQPLRAALIWGLCFALFSALGVVALQVWIDGRLVDKTMANIAVLDRDMAELQREIAQRKEQAAGSSGKERLSHEKELGTLEARLLLRKIHALNAIRSVKLLRFVRSDPEVDRKARDRLSDLFNTGVDGKHSLLLHALAETVIEDIEEGRAIILHGEKDIARMRAFQERAAKASGLQP